MQQYIFVFHSLRLAFLDDRKCINNILMIQVVTFKS